MSSTIGMCQFGSKRPNMGSSKPIFTCNYLKLYSWMGFFPCLKNEEAKLFPMGWKLQLLLYCISTVIPYGVFISYFIFLTTHYDLSFTHFFAMLRASNDESLNMGTALYWSVISTLYVQHLILQLRTRKIKDGLCEMQQILNQRLGTCSRKFTQRSVIMTVLVVCSSVSFAIGFHINLRSFLDINLPILIIGIILSAFTTTILSSPIFAFYYIYGEISRGLEEWILSIVHDLKATPKLTNAQFNTCRKLHSALLKSSSLLSFNVLVVLLVSLIALIVVVFMSFDFFMSHADFASAGVILVFLGYITYVLKFAYIVCIFNHDSEHLYNQVQSLKNALEEIYIEDHEFLFFHGQLRDARFAKQLIINQLQDFKGFDGLGYFTLGKPLLTSITANILTYLIVLIQFKLSENTV